MNFGRFIKLLAILFIIVAVFGAAMFALNLHTGPIIEANHAGAELEPLLAVMPEGAAFDGDALIYDADDASASSLTGVGEQVLKIYKEANGNGFAIRCKTVDNYESAPIKLTFGVSADGKICGVQIDEYTDSIDVRSKDAGFLPSFVGKDSALADVNLVAGCTFSSSSIKNAISVGLEALISNGMIAEGVKSDAQILTELIPSVFPGMTSDGNLKAETVAASGNITAAYKANNDAGFAYIMTEGENSYLAVVNAMGVCKVYDVEGTDVTADKSALADEAKAHASSNQKDYADNGSKKFAKLFEGAEELTAIELDTFNTVVYAASFKVGDTTYYGFYSRSLGFDQMDVYVVIDENGAIAKLDAAALFFETEYFPVDDTVNQSAYKDSFTGMTSDTFTGDNAMIAGATMTSNAVKTSTADAFEAFATIEKGGEQE